MKLLIVLVVVLLTLGLALWLGKTNWERETATLIGKLQATAKPDNGTVDLAETESLPEPVRRYFQLVLSDGLPMIRHARMTQSGGFRASPEQAGWSPMQAEQYFSVRPRAFTWNARITMLPGVAINVLDAYHDGRGGMRGKILALLPLMDVGDTPELNAAALQRYLAEAVWFPTALLPSQGVHWSALDDRRAKAEITDNGITVSLEFTFAGTGEIVGVYSPDRFREVGGHYEPTPWKGSFTDYREVDGYRIPHRGEVEWHLPQQTYPYWQAELTGIKYN